MHLWTSDLDPTQSFSATRGVFTNLWELAMRSPTRLRFPQLAPYVPTWQTALPSLRWYHILVAPANLWWSPYIYNAMATSGLATAPRGHLAFGKRFGPLGIYPSLHKVDYNLLHARPMVPTWYHSMVNVSLLYGPQWDYDSLSLNANSLNLLCGTYTQLCLYLSNPSTNLTSFSALALQSLPRSFCASG
jgi:hypothetical protein